MTPSAEISEIREMNACLRLASRYRIATKSSNGRSIFRVQVLTEFRVPNRMTSGSRDLALDLESYFARISGNRMTSRIDGLLVSSMTSRSMPTPSPAVGGSPYSSARM